MPKTQESSFARARTWLILALGLPCACALDSHGAQARDVAVVTRPSAAVEQREAVTYVLDLINRDRKAAGLSPLGLDETASRAAARHAADMAAHGFTAHWGSDGSVPEQRYTEAGGVHLAKENVACLFDGVKRELDPKPRFAPEAIERLQGLFMAEAPPHDGHKKNILDPSHTKVGIGLAQPAGVDQPCLAQEFVDEAGSYASLPSKLSRDGRLRVGGEITPPLSFGAIGIKRGPAPKARSAAELNATEGYPIPPPDVLYFPAGFRTPQPVLLDGPKFFIDVGLFARARPGLYSVSIWARQPGSNQLFMVSLRTIVVD